ncbi:hypothetical protein [Streptococcus uberis]|uniref:hypothetical protein n=1 Tax=Streptococcus uberis TaxID=1349 RepID=UPI001FF2CC85|nr:hypothetical protein [Streptococcus uberis]MCK1189763.1 hypothetical protein [Streptococcus uberis]
MKTYPSLDDIFADEHFDVLVDEIRPKKIESLDPEIEKFQEILTWVEIKGVLPKKNDEHARKETFFSS